MGQYRRLTLTEREELSRMLAAGHSLRATARAMSRAPSTLSRELTRHRTSPVTYRAVPAHQRAQRWAHRVSEAQKTNGPAALAYRRLAAPCAALVARTDCSRLTAAVSCRTDHADLTRSHLYLSVCVAVRGLEARTRSLSASTAPVSSAAQNAPLFTAHSGPHQHRRPAHRSGRPHRAGALGRRLVGRPCQCVRARHSGGAHHTVYAAGPAESQGRRHRETGLRARTADAAGSAPSLAHLRSGSRNAGAPSLHAADEDARLLCASALSLGAGHEREHQWSAAAVLSQGHTVYPGITCGDQTGAGDASTIGHGRC